MGDGAVRGGHGPGLCGRVFLVHPRAAGLRPACEPCAAARTPREFAVIDHPAGEETQSDWVELPDPPAGWGWGRQAHLLVGVLSHSGRWRGVLAGSEDQAYLVASLQGVSERLGGLTRRWRFDRMATVCHPDTGDLTASFAEIAKGGFQRSSQH